MSFCVVKDAGAEAVYGFKWHEFNAAVANGAELVSATWSIVTSESPQILTIKDLGLFTYTDESVSPNVLYPNSFAKVKVSGGTAGKTYELKCVAITNESPSQTEPEFLRITVV